MLEVANVFRTVVKPLPETRAAALSPSHPAMVEHWLLRFATGTRSLATPTTVASGVGAVACKGKGCRAGFFFLGDNR